MGRNIPKNRLDQIQWFEDRIDQWNADPAAIGLTPELVAELSAQLAAARDAYTNAQAARAQAISATQGFHAEADALHELGGDAVESIKAFAEATGGNGVYSQASVCPPKATRSAAPAPRQPFDIRTALNKDGSVSISFDGAGPTGTLYFVHSKPHGSETFAFVGQSDASTKSFTDTTITPGTKSVTYMVQAVRGKAKSPWSEQVTVRFGVAGKTASEMSIAA